MDLSADEKKRIYSRAYHAERKRLRDLGADPEVIAAGGRIAGNDAVLHAGSCISERCHFILHAGPRIWGSIDWHMFDSTCHRACGGGIASQIVWSHRLAHVRFDIM